jgi:hypothetical protein
MFQSNPPFPQIPSVVAHALSIKAEPGPIGVYIFHRRDVDANMRQSFHQEVLPESNFMLRLDFMPK